MARSIFSTICSKPRVRTDRQERRHLRLGQCRDARSGEGNPAWRQGAALADSAGFIHDRDGIDQHRINWVKEHKTRRRGRISDYAKEFKSATFHEGKRPWGVPCDVALPCATQNELLGEDARTLVKNGCIAVSEGANMPTDLEGVHVFKDAKILFGSGKAANAGGVAVSENKNRVRLF